MGGDVENPQSLNRYTYTNNNPTSLVDPLGLQTISPGFEQCFEIGYEFEQWETWNGEEVFLMDSWTEVTGSQCPQMEGGNHGGGGGSDSESEDQRQKNCAQGLKGANKTMAAVNRALQDWGMIEDAAEASDVDPAMIAAVGVRETGFLDVTENDGANKGVGIYQLTVIKGSPKAAIETSQANDPSTAALIAGGILRDNMNYMADHYPSYTGSYLLQAAAAEYNMGPTNKKTGKSNFSGDPAKIDQGTADPTGGTGNYGADILLLMDCFPHD